MDQNTQETNENLDRLHPEYPAQYVLINEETGTVVWFENYRSAVKAHVQQGGIILNTETCTSRLISDALKAARDKMNNNGARADK